MNHENLPPDARTKLTSLSMQCSEYKAAADAIYQRIRDCEARCVRLANLRGSAGSEELAAEYTRKLDAARDEREQLVSARTRHDKQYRNAAQVVARIELWLDRCRDGTKLRVVTPRPITVEAGTLGERLAKVRGDIDRFRGEIEQAERMPMDRESLIAGIEAQVSEWADNCHVRFEGMDGSTPLRVIVDVSPRCPQHYDAWINPDALKARLIAELPDGEGMTAAAKADTLARLRARLLSAERAEEAAITAGEVHGIATDRRPDADPRAVLGIELGSTAVSQAA